MAKTTPRGKLTTPATAPLSRVEVTSDTLTGRGGRVLFSRYIGNVGVFEHLERLFGPLRGNGKGLQVSELL